MTKKRRILKWLSLGSLTLCLGFVIMFARSYWRCDGCYGELGSTHRFHLQSQGGGFSVLFVPRGILDVPFAHFSSNANWLPLAGIGGPGITRRHWEAIGFAYAMGWSLYPIGSAPADGADPPMAKGTFHVLAIPYWFCILASAALPLWCPPRIIRGWIERRRAKKGLCAQCGYDLRASTERCPECGHPIQAGTTQTTVEISTTTQTPD